MVFGSSRQSAAAADADAASPAAAPAATQEKRRRKKKSASDKSASAADPAGAEEEQSSPAAAKETSALDTAVNKTKSAQELIASGGAVVAGDVSAEDFAAQQGGARTQAALGVAGRVSGGESVGDVASGLAADEVAGANEEALAKINEKKNEVKEEMARAKSIAKGEVSAGEMVANNAYDKATAEVSKRVSAVEEKIQRKLCGVGEKGANNAKVFFILLTGLLAVVEAVLITTTTQRSVYIDMEFALKTAGDTEILKRFEPSKFLPSCISDRRGIGGYDQMSPPSAPPPSIPTGATASPPPPALPPPPDSTEGQAVAALTSSQSLTNLWYADTDESQCKDDPLFSGKATADKDCGAQPKWCGACERSTIEAAGFELTNDEWTETKPGWCDTDCAGDWRNGNDANLWENNWKEWKQCEQYVSLYFGMQLGLPIGEYTVKDAIQGLANFFTMTLFLSAVCYTGSRIALHYLTMRGSQLCDCCPGCVRTCLLTFLKKGGPIALNSLMIINTKMAWNEGGENGVASHVYGYSLGFGQLELIFFFVNVLFMIVSILIGFMLFVAPTCCAGMIKICCKACGGKTNAVRRVKQCARGYLVLALYILSFWGFVTTIVTAALKYVQEVGLDIPSSPSIAIQSFPLIDILMTLIMFPPNLAIQLGSKLTLVKLVGAVRICKVISVCIPISIDIHLQLLEWKYAGPPCKCCTKCFPWCGRGDMPQQGKELKEIKVEGGGGAPKGKKGGKGAKGAADAAEESAAEAQGAATDAAAEAQQTATELKEIDLQERLGQEVQKLGDQLVENTSADLQALKDAAPTNSRDSLNMAKDWASEKSEKADAKADSEQQKAEEKKKAEEKEKPEDA